MISLMVVIDVLVGNVLLKSMWDQSMSLKLRVTHSSGLLLSVMSAGAVSWSCGCDCDVSFGVSKYVCVLMVPFKN